MITVVFSARRKTRTAPVSPSKLNETILLWSASELKITLSVCVVAFYIYEIIGFPPVKLATFGKQSLALTGVAARARACGMAYVCLTFKCVRLLLSLVLRTQTIVKVFCVILWAGGDVMQWYSGFESQRRIVAVGEMHVFLIERPVRASSSQIMPSFILIFLYILLLCIEDFSILCLVTHCLKHSFVVFLIEWWVCVFNNDFSKQTSGEKLQLLKGFTLALNRFINIQIYF